MEKHFHSHQFQAGLKKSKNSNASFQYFGEAWDFEEALSRQKKAFDSVSLNNSHFYFLAGVHKPVFTVGKSLSTKILIDSENGSNPPCVKTDRGGLWMHHGQGQLTCYPVFMVKNFFKGPRDYTKFLFDLCIEHFKENHGLVLNCRNNGLWNEQNKKVGFVGLRLKEGITYHGLSLNYRADLSAFLERSPCDISGSQAGNIYSPGESCPNLENEAKSLYRRICERLTLAGATL
jgi:lipoate-protein ligase B